LTEGKITSSPAIGTDGDIFFTSTDGNLYRLKPDGREAWRFRTGGGSAGSPVLAENGNIVIADSHQVFILSPVGALLWRCGVAVWEDETPAVAQGVIYFSATWRQFWARQPNGDEAWSAPVEHNLSSSPVISAQGRIYFCDETFLEALQPPVARPPASSPWPMFRANARHTGRVGD
jgi:outer membrane protein assembly factor BamB